MTRLSGSLRQVSIGHIVRCADALTMVRPALLVLITLLIAALVIAAGTSMAKENTWITLIAGLLSFCIVATGLSGAGVLLMDGAREVEPRSLMDAGVFGFMCLPQALLLGFIYLLIFLAATVIAALLFFLGKIPGIGPFLLALTFPPITLIFGVMIFSLFVVVVPLTLPALWEGKSVTETLGVVMAVIKERLIMVVVSFLLLYVILIVAGGVVTAVILGGISSATAIAMRIIGPENLLGISSIMDIATQIVGALSGSGSGYAVARSIDRALSGGGSGYVVALSIDVALMMAVVVASLGEAWIMGINLVYLSAVEGLDTAGAQQAIREGIEKTKQRAEEMKRHAQDAAAHARQAAEGARAKSASAAPGVPHCPACKGVVKVGAGFCGHCGYDLR